MSDFSTSIGTTESVGARQIRIPFFDTRDKLAFLVAFLVALAGYLYTLAPSVTLDYSGEFLTVAHNLGVPHPPGYAAWTMLAWLWQRIIPFGNIAWRVNLMSTFFGALAIGLTALLISKSGHVMALRCGFLERIENERIIDLVVLAGSVSAALMLAFSPVMWSQSVITEVYTLNALLLMGTLVLLYRWSFETERRWRLYLAAFLWGTSLTNHQTLVLLAVAFPAFVWLTDRRLGRDTLAPVLAVFVLGVLKMVVTPGSLFRQGTFSAAWILVHGIGAGVWLYFLWKEGPGLMEMWRQVIAIYAAVMLGMALYVYVPLAAATNPAINWGHAQTPAALVHHVMSGQYEKVHPERTPLQLWGQINMFFDDLKSQFTIVYALIALVALFFYRDLAPEDRNWMLFLLMAFLFIGMDFIFLSNPPFDRQKQFVDHISFLPCHCLYAMWIGYGLILGCGNLFSEKASLRSAWPVIVVLIFALPVAPVFINWADNEQRGHDFGYQFGYRMFKPGGDYPDMDKDAILFGGTDQGRFVPTYMIFVESQVPTSARTRMAEYPESGDFDRRDVYIITQSALADRRYIENIRDHYGASRPDPRNPETMSDRPGWQRVLFDVAWDHMGRDQAYPKEPIWIPGNDDLEAALRQYIDELRGRQPLPGEEVKIENGHVSVQGVTSVMAVNGYVAKSIFDHNKDKHTFYVEESYMIPWMYPYLEPYGLILKINSSPIPAITPEMVARDRAYWDALFGELRNNPRFQRDDVAQKTFSKLRSTIGGLYAFRHMTAEAEYAYQQAITLCPDSPEGNFRLAQLYVDLGRFDDGVRVLEEYQKRDRYNARIPDAIDTVRRLKVQAAEQHELELQYAAQPGNLQLALQLIDSYAKRQRVEAMDPIVASIVAQADVPAEMLLQIAQAYIAVGRLDRASELLTVMAQRYPQAQAGWYNLAVVESARKNCDEAIVALEHALALDDATHRLHESALHDRRLDNCRQQPGFEQIMNQQTYPPLGSAELPGGVTIGH